MTSALPQRLEALYQSVTEVAESEEAVRQAEQLYKTASVALRSDDQEA